MSMRSCSITSLALWSDVSGTKTSCWTPEPVSRPPLLMLAHVVPFQWYRYGESAPDVPATKILASSVPSADTAVAGPGRSDARPGTVQVEFW